MITQSVVAQMNTSTRSTLHTHQLHAHPCVLQSTAKPVAAPSHFYRATPEVTLLSMHSCEPQLFLQYLDPHVSPFFRQHGMLGI